jgi:hypothetical protein
MADEKDLLREQIGWREQIRTIKLRLLLYRSFVPASAQAIKELARYMLQPLSDGKPGRPVSADRDAILRTWDEIGRPSLAKYALARKLYGTAFNKADGPDKNRMRDRCRRAVERALNAQSEKVD